MAHKLFSKAKEEGMHFEVNWQDQDSSSGKSFRSVFLDGQLSRVMLCGGHVGRSNGKNLKEYKSKKVLDKGFIDQHKWQQLNASVKVKAIPRSVVAYQMSSWQLQKEKSLFCFEAKLKITS